MLNITKQEKTVLIFIAAVIMTGSVLSMIFRKYPELRDYVNLIDSDKLYQKVDINKASLEELVAIPYLGEYTSRNIIEYRRVNGPFKSVEELKRVKGIKEKNYQKFSIYLKAAERNP